MVSGIRNINRGSAYGGNVAFAWKPSDDFSIRLNAIVQDLRSNGSPFADPTLGDLKQNDIPNTGTSRTQSQNYMATIEGRVGDFQITSVTGYGIYRGKQRQDLTPLLGSTMLDAFGVEGAVVPIDFRTKRFTEELRVSYSLGTLADWTVGGFYNHETSQVDYDYLAADPNTGAIVDNFVLGVPTTFREYAVFSNLSVHPAAGLDIQLGFRNSHNRQTYSEVNDGNIGEITTGVPGPIINPRVVTKDSSTTYMATIQYKFNPDLMVYGRYATGYRAGGPNPLCVVSGYACQFGPDTTENYEVGLKGTVFDKALTFEFSLYSIKWKDIQIQVFNELGGFYVNASQARSRGAEFSATLRPWKGGSLNGSATYNDAALSRDFPAGSAYGVKGDRLPFAAKFSASIAAEQRFDLDESLAGVLGLNVSYVGSRVGSFIDTADRQRYPAYTEIDVRAGLESGSWTFTVYAKNLTDKRGLLSGGIGAFNRGFQFIRPRTIGATVSKTF